MLEAQSIHSDQVQLMKYDPQGHPDGGVCVSVLVLPLTVAAVHTLTPHVGHLAMGMLRTDDQPKLHRVPSSNWHRHAPQAGHSPACHVSSMSLINTVCLLGLAKGQPLVGTQELIALIILPDAKYRTPQSQFLSLHCFCLTC